MAVTKSSYLSFSNRNKQELYFSSKMNHEFWIKGRDAYGMKRDANFMKKAVDDFWLKPVQEEFVDCEYSLHSILVCIARALHLDMRVCPMSTSAGIAT